MYITIHQNATPRNYYGWRFRKPGNGDQFDLGPHVAQSGAPDGTKRSLEPVWPVLFDQQLPLGAFANCTCGSQKPKMIPTKVCECALCANACQKLCALWPDLFIRCDPVQFHPQWPWAMNMSNLNGKPTNFRKPPVSLTWWKYNVFKDSQPESTSWGTNDVIYDHVLLQMRFEHLNQKPVSVVWT